MGHRHLLELTGVAHKKWLFCCCLCNYHDMLVTFQFSLSRCHVLFDFIGDLYCRAAMMSHPVSVRSWLRYQHPAYTPDQGLLYCNTTQVTLSPGDKSHPGNQSEQNKLPQSRQPSCVVLHNPGIYNFSLTSWIYDVRIFIYYHRWLLLWLSSHKRRRLHW